MNGPSQLAAGSGPRHLDWHPSAPLAYLLCELDGRLLTCAWDEGTGGLAPQHSISTLPAGVPPRCFALPPPYFFTPYFLLYCL